MLFIKEHLIIRNIRMQKLDLLVIKYEINFIQNLFYIKY